MPFVKPATKQSRRAIDAWTRELYGPQTIPMPMAMAATAKYECKFSVVPSHLNFLRCLPLMLRYTVADADADAQDAVVSRSVCQQESKGNNSTALQTGTSQKQKLKHYTAQILDVESGKGAFSCAARADDFEAYLVTQP